MLQLAPAFYIFIYGECLSLGRLFPAERVFTEIARVSTECSLSETNCTWLFYFSDDQLGEVRNCI